MLIAYSAVLWFLIKLLSFGRHSLHFKWYWNLNSVLKDSSLLHQHDLVRFYLSHGVLRRQRDRVELTSTWFVLDIRLDFTSVHSNEIFVI